MARKRTDKFQTVLTDKTRWIYILEKHKKYMNYKTNNTGLKLAPRRLVPKGSVELFVWEK